MIHSTLCIHTGPRASVYKSTMHICKFWPNWKWTKYFVYSVGDWKMILIIPTYDSMENVLHTSLVSDDRPGDGFGGELGARSSAGMLIMGIIVETSIPCACIGYLTKRKELIIFWTVSHLIAKAKNSLEPNNYPANMCCTAKSSIIDHQAHHAVSRAHVA